VLSTNAPRRQLAGAPRTPGSRAGRTVALAAAGIASLAPLPSQAAPRSGPAECRAAAATRDTIAGLGPRGELRLGSGGQAVLGSLRWPEEPEDARAAEAWLQARVGQPLTLVARGEADRWGRIRVDAQTEGADATDLAGGLIGAGLAPADAGEGETLCRPALLALEEAPRAAGRGIWARPRPAATDGTALRARAGRFAIVEGRVRRVGERAARTYLDFGPSGEDALTVTVSKRTWRRLLERGLSAAGLRGRRVRARGILEIWRGPTLDVASAEAIEVLPEEARDDGLRQDANGEPAPRR